LTKGNDIIKNCPLNKNHDKESFLTIFQELSIYYYKDFLFLFYIYF